MGEVVCEGMTLRDYFAAKAVEGMAKHNNNAESTAKAAYQLADAMLTERERRDV